MSYCNNNTHNINITPKLSYVIMEQKSNKQNPERKSPEILVGQNLIETIIKEMEIIGDILREVANKVQEVANKVQEVEDRLDNVDIEDIADRLEIVEDWDASDRLFDVESDLETLESRVEALEGKSK